jgi:hypothetical protein
MLQPPLLKALTVLWACFVAKHCTESLIWLQSLADKSFPWFKDEEDKAPSNAVSNL